MTKGKSILGAVMGGRWGHAKGLVSDPEVADHINEPSFPFSYRSCESTELIVAAEQGVAGAVELLLTVPGIDINLGHQSMRGDYGYTALMFAARRGHEEILDKILAAPDIDVNVRGYDDGKSALIIAAEMKRDGIVRSLLSVPGIDVNAKDNEGNTALMVAACKNHLAVAELILGDARVNVNSSNVLGETALMLLAREVRKNLDRGGCCYPPGSHAEKIARLLVAHPDIDVDIRNNEGKTALQLAGNGPIGVVLSDAVDERRIVKKTKERLTSAKPGTVATGEPEAGAPQAKAPEAQGRAGS